jgi:hypothetical protein
MANLARPRVEVNRLREAWTKDVRLEAEARCEALAEHFTHRLESLPICLAD